MIDASKLRAIANDSLNPSGSAEFERLMATEGGGPELAREFLLGVLERADINESLPEEQILELYKRIDATETSGTG